MHNFLLVVLAAAPASAFIAQVSSLRVTGERAVFVALMCLHRDLRPKQTENSAAAVAQGRGGRPLCVGDSQSHVYCLVAAVAPSFLESFLCQLPCPLRRACHRMMIASRVLSYLHVVQLLLPCMSACIATAAGLLNSDAFMACYGLTDHHMLPLPYPLCANVLTTCLTALAFLPSPLTCFPHPGTTLQHTLIGNFILLPDHGD